MDKHDLNLRAGINQFNQQLAELRGKYGRKGKRGGSSKTPTSSSNPASIQAYRKAIEKYGFKSKNEINVKHRGTNVYGDEELSYTKKIGKNKFKITITFENSGNSQIKDVRIFPTGDMIATWIEEKLDMRKVKNWDVYFSGLLGKLDKYAKEINSGNVYLE